MHEMLNRIVDEIGTVLLDKHQAIRLAVACLLARGHLLIEDLPGMGKTLLAHALARTLGLEYRRVQFTSDVLPADILGTSIFERDAGVFRFVEGPIFTQVLLADEINRTTPKTQSALLEAMEEGQVSVEGETRMLPSPFFVIATQNPVHQAGTYPLPESQLDRFLMRITLGYPSPQAERALLRGSDRRQQVPQIEPVLGPEALREAQARVESVQVSDPLVDYVQRLVQASREHEALDFGLSPRGALALIRAARAWALVGGRDFVTPEDVQAVLAPVVEHRLRGSLGGGQTEGALADELLDRVDVVPRG